MFGLGGPVWCAGPPAISANSRVRASTLSNKRTFSIAITAWSAKVVASSICFSVNGRDF